MRHKKAALVLLILLCVMAVSPLCAQDNTRFKFMGTANITMPTAYTRSSAAYISDDGHTAFFLSQCLFTDFIELSMLRHQNGVTKDHNTMSIKFKLMDEGSLLPTISYGISDFAKELGDRVHYASLSKSIDAFGLQIHAGIYRDPEKKENVEYYGVEKMILPLITVCAERLDDIDAYGLKICPYPGLNLEFSLRDRDEEVYNINYYLAY